MKATKSKLTAEQSLTKSLEHIKKCILQPKTKKKKTVAGVLFQYNQILYLPGGQPTNLKIITLQRFSHTGVRVLSPTLGFKPWDLGQRKGSSQTFGFEGQ